jgi:hypothetical protein
MPEAEKNRKPDKRPPLESYARYSGMALQMLVIIGAGTYAGIKLDHWLNLQFPVFALLLSLVSVFAAIYTAVKDLLKK